MPDAARFHHPLRLFAAAAIAAASAISFIGCASAPPPPSVLPTAFSQLPTHLLASMGEHVVEFQCPTPGYQPSLTRSLDEHLGKGVYITLRSPDPAVNYPQRLVTQRIATGVPITTTLNVYVRLIPFDASDDTDAPFAIAASAQGTVPVPQPPK